MSGPVRAAYDALVAANELKPDPAQAAASDALDRIGNGKNGGLLSRLLNRDDDGPAGVYLWGGVGRGKTMLMDLFYDTLPSTVRSKTRIHFNNFMQDVHHRMHLAKMEHGNDIDAVPLVAADLADRANVLCFDEFQCTNVADAMILRRLLESLMSHGVVLVTTSNRHPDELYKNGVQRESFIPAINLLKREKIAHTVRSYVHDAHAESYGGEAVDKLGLDPAQVFKTLLASTEAHELLVAIVPVAGQLDLKALAEAAGCKKCEMAAADAAQRATGYLVGGISPLSQRTPLPTVVHDSALRFTTVFVSAGRRGLQVELAPSELVSALDATVAGIAR